ncbi:hypothetical protein FKM82_024567 [Ascaphus truei]
MFFGYCMRAHVICLCPDSVNPVLNFFWGNVVITCFLRVFFWAFKVASLAAAPVSGVAVTGGTVQSGDSRPQHPRHFCAAQVEHLWSFLPPQMRLQFGRRGVCGRFFGRHIFHCKATKYKCFKTCRCCFTTTCDLTSAPNKHASVVNVSIH